MESRYIHKRHNVSVLMYHLVCAAKYRRVVMSKHVDKVLREACLEIEKRWEIVFLEIGMDRDHAHFLIQSVPTYSGRMFPIVKSDHFTIKTADFRHGAVHRVATSSSHPVSNQSNEKPGFTPNLLAISIGMVNMFFEVTVVVMGIIE